MSSLIAELESADQPPHRRAGEKRLRVGMLSREQCLNVYHLLARVVAMEVPGDVAELGCHGGGGAILIQKTLTSLDSPARLHVYDSFEGLPASDDRDAMEDGKFFLSKGDLALGEGILLNNFTQAGLPPPEIHKGWFSDTLPGQLPAQICFAHLDGDLFSSTMEGLVALYPRLSPKAILVVDDYCDPSLFPKRNILPGVKQACDEFFNDKPEAMLSLFGGTECHGYFVKA